MKARIGFLLVSVAFLSVSAAQADKTEALLAPSAAPVVAPQDPSVPSAPAEATKAPNQKKKRKAPWKAAPIPRR